MEPEYMEIEIIELVSPELIGHVLPSLPYEIWFEIFNFFSIHDRRNFRLVCKQWLEVCDDPRFLRKDSFFFNASYALPAIMKIIGNSGRELVNLKLQSYVIDEESNCLWETFGPKINSLKLSLCYFDGTILGHIFVSCPNMTEFSVQGGFYKSSAVSLPTKFMHLGENTLRREKLEKFEFEAPSMPIINSDLDLIFRSFPNLKSLAITLCIEETFWKKEKNLGHFQALLKLLSKESSKIDTLYVNIEDGGILFRDQLPILRLKCMGEHDLSKLKDVGMRFAEFTLNDDSMNTIFRYKFWTSLTLTSHRIGQEKFCKFLIKLFEECPSLTYFETFWKISKDEQFFTVFPAIVKSRLKSLSFEINDRSLPENQAFSLEDKAKTRLENLSKNHTLSHLTLTWAQAYGFDTIFMYHFPDVRHLRLSHGTLPYIFTALKNLLTLEVDGNAYDCDRFSETPRTSVTGLLSLSISALCFDKFSRVKFPDLRFLTLTIFHNELYEMEHNDELGEYYVDNDDSASFPEAIGSILVMAAQNAPNIRELTFDCCDLNERYLKCETGDCSRDVLSVFFKSCQKFSQLRRVKTSVSSELEDELCKRHIVECYKENTSLRAVYCSTLDNSFYSFFNILENKVEFYEAARHNKDKFYKLSFAHDMVDYLLDSRQRAS